MNRKILFAIPARGGSKRLPRKNLVKLGGQPMLAFTIQAALESRLSDDVYVCTEDSEIATVAEEYGARVHWIPTEMSGDEVSSTIPCLDLMSSLLEAGLSFDYLCNLQPSSPLRTAEDVRNSLEWIKETGSDFLVSVTATDPHYFHWAMVNDSDVWRMYFREEFLKERTQLPPVYRPNGAIKLARASAVKEVSNFFGQPSTVYHMPEERSIHVATDFDLRCAAGVLNGVTDA